VHDPEAVAPVNGYAELGGLTAEEVREAVVKFRANWVLPLFG
jgi:hypothetical protein